MGLLEHTRRIAQHLVATLQGAGSGSPPARESGVEQLTRARLMIPDGDRRQGTQSRRIEVEPISAGVGHQNVMGVLVLRQDQW